MVDHGAHAKYTPADNVRMAVTQPLKVQKERYLVFQANKKQENMFIHCCINFCNFERTISSSATALVTFYWHYTLNYGTITHYLALV